VRFGQREKVIPATESGKGVRMPELKSDLKGSVEILKDLLGVLRDCIVFILFVLLLFFPSKINQVLRDAGFTKGSIAGFTWEKEISASAQQAKGAGQAVTSLEGKLQEFADRLEEIQKQAHDSSVKSSIQKLSKDVESSQQEVRSANQAVKNSLLTQQRIIEQVAPTTIETTGWLYLGKVTEDKKTWTPGYPINIPPVDAVLSPGTRVTIRDSAYLRGDTTSGSRSSSSILSVLRVGETVEIFQVDYSHAIGGGWFVWAKVREVS